MHLVNEFFQNKDVICASRNTATAERGQALTFLKSERDILKNKKAEVIAHFLNQKKRRVPVVEVNEPQIQLAAPKRNRETVIRE